MVHGDYTARRPHVQGSPAALRVRGGGGRIADAGGLVVVRRLWDALGLGGWIDLRSGDVPGRYRPSLMVELWVVLLLCGGGVMDDLPLLERRGVRRVLGWARVPHPATFGRWLRAAAWLAKLVDRLREAGVRRITVRLDKGFFSRRIVRRMEELGVSYLLKVPRHAWLDGFRGAWRTADRDEAGDRELRTASGELWGTRLLSVERRERTRPKEGELDLAAWETTLGADVLTDIRGIGPAEAWRAHNAGAVVEQRIGELGQLSAGRTAVDDLGGNELLWRIAVLAYQLLHILRSNVLGGRWRAVQPRGIRLRLLRAPARITSHARRISLRFASADPALDLLRRALGAIELDLPPPAPA